MGSFEYIVFIPVSYTHLSVVNAGVISVAIIGYSIPTIVVGANYCVFFTSFCS